MKQSLGKSIAAADVQIEESIVVVIKHTQAAAVITQHDAACCGLINKRDSIESDLSGSDCGEAAGTNNNGSFEHDKDSLQ